MTIRQSLPSGSAPSTWRSVPKFIALCANAVLLLPCSCFLGLVAAAADVGVSESYRARFAGFLFGGLSILNIAVLSGLSRCSRWRALRWISAGGNMFVIAWAAVMTMAVRADYPFSGRIGESVLLIMAPALTLLALAFERTDTTSMLPTSRSDSN
jgi:hypothetical protein